MTACGMMMCIDTSYTLEKLLVAWDNICVLCGEGFKDLDCVTCEHLVPKSMGGRRTRENIAPTHYVCNHLRGTLSIIDTMHVLDALKVIKGERFFEWVNAPEPNAISFIKKFGAVRVQTVRATWDVLKKWPWWKFQEKKGKR